MNIEVIIPSYNRPKGLLGKDYFGMAKYCVPESQKKLYVNEVGKDRVITLPDDEDGDICKKRNWILDNIPRPMLMIDDDVERLCYFEGRVSGGNHKMRTMEKDTLMPFFEQSFHLAKEFGARQWGLAQNFDDRVYKEFLPFSLSNICLGPFQGHLDHSLKFDPRMGTKDDYDMALQQLKTYKVMLRWNKYNYVCEHGDNEGGIVSYRTSKKEEQYCRAIMKKWGSHIIKYQLPAKKKVDLLNAAKVNIPISGV